MIRMRNNRVLVLSATLVAYGLCGTPDTARAGLIPAFSAAGGQHGFNSITGCPSGPIGATLNVQSDSSATDTINGQSIAAVRFGDVLSISASGAITVAGFNKVAGGTMYTFSLPNPNPAGIGVNAFILQDLGTVTLIHTSLTGFVADADPSVLQLSGHIRLVSRFSSNTVYDFSPFASDGLFAVTVPSFVNINTAFSTQGTTPLSPFPSGGPVWRWEMEAIPIPEPAGLTMAGIGAVCLMGNCWRRRRNKT
jgi:hypothetical protein